MNKLLLSLTIFVSVLVLVGCKSNNSTKTEDAQEEIINFKTYHYKVQNLSDTVIADSIWRMIFKMNEGIDQISIQDTMVIVKVNTDVYEEKEIRDEMIKRGAQNVELVQ
ncbi:MAG: hypothetical protein MI922_12860 [Bacteroidales bacterium]|nr:hypothetical protein [Bacteroidales bacterium]